jgi:O-antigen/teichoic acid export membrane protein
MVCLLPIIFLNQFLQAIFQGNEDFKSFNFTLMSGQTLNLVFAFITLTILSFGVEAALFAFVCGQIFTLVTISYILKKKIKYNDKIADFSFPYLRDSINFGLKAHLSNILAFVNYRADLFIIAYFLTPLEVGLYTVAVNVSERLWILSQAISTVLYPKISSLTSSYERNNLTSIICRNMMILSLIGGLLLIITAEILIALLFGKPYEQSALILQLLIPGIIFGSISRIIANDFAGRGKPELNMNVSFLTVSINIILNFILIPFYGVNGAAISTSISYFVNWFIKVILFKRITDSSYRAFLVPTRHDIEISLMKFKSILKMKKEV